MRPAPRAASLGIALALALGAPAASGAPDEALHDLPWFVHVDLIDAGAGQDLAFWAEWIEDHLATATELLQGYNGPADTPCCTGLGAVSVSAFGSPGDGLDVIETQMELDSILTSGAAGAYLVESVWYCVAFSMGIRGCANVPGDRLVVAREADDGALGGFMPALIAHERGHNTGLNHASANPCELMAASNAGSCLSTAECESFIADANATGPACACLADDAGDPRVADGSLCGAAGSCELCWGGLCRDCNSAASTSLVSAGGAEDLETGDPDGAMAGFATTGGWSELGAIEFGESTLVTGVAWDPTRATLFGVTPGAGNDLLITLDPETGMKTGDVGTLDRANLISLTYDPDEDRLLAIATDVFCPPDTTDACDGPLIAIDPADAGVTEIGTPLTITPGGFQGLAYDDATSTLYASAGSGVYSIDTGASCAGFCATTQIHTGSLLPSSLAFDRHTGYLVRMGTRLVGGSLYQLLDPATGDVVTSFGIDGFAPGGMAAVCADIDGDGVCNTQDTCIADANPDQSDTAGDGYGNLCDADYDNDGFVGGTDFNLFRLAFQSAPPDPAYNPSVDSDSDNAIGATDFNFFRLSFLKPPGPSGLACAGTIPCP